MRSVKRHYLGDRIRAPDFNRLVEASNALVKASGKQGLAFSLTPAGLSIDQRGRSFTLPAEPAVAVKAKNTEEQHFGALDVCQLMWPGLYEHQPLSDPYYVGDRVVEMRLPQDSACGLIGVVADRIEPDEVGDVFMAGICLAFADGFGEAEWDWDSSNRASSFQDAWYLIPCNAGSAEVLWVSPILRQDVPRRVAVIRFGQRVTEGVGIQERGRYRRDKRGRAEVIVFDDSVQLTRLASGIVRVSPSP